MHLTNQLSMQHTIYISPTSYPRKALTESSTQHTINVYSHPSILRSHHPTVPASYHSTINKSHNSCILILALQHLYITNQLSTHHPIYAFHLPTIHASQHPCILPYKYLTNQLFKYHTIHASQQPTIQASYYLNYPRITSSTYPTIQLSTNQTINASHY